MHVYKTNNITHKHKCTLAYIQTCMHVCMHACMACIFIGMCVCVRACVRACLPACLLCMHAWRISMTFMIIMMMMIIIAIINNIIIIYYCHHYFYQAFMYASIHKKDACMRMYTCVSAFFLIHECVHDANPILTVPKLKQDDFTNC